MHRRMDWGNGYAIFIILSGIKKGRILSIFDKENDREILKAGELGNHLVVYEDRPMKYDAWDIDIYYQEKGYEVDDLKRFLWKNLL